MRVCLLFSFLEDAHERKRRRGAARDGTNGLMISLSSEVQPEFREYERFSTAVLNAYLQPVMGRYLSYLEQQARTEDAPDAKVGIYQSSGGLMSIDTARRFPVRTALVGAGGRRGRRHSQRALGEAAERHHARHGRHQRGRRPDPRLRGRA